MSNKLGKAKIPPLFKAERRLIALDGPDGVGKGTFGKILKGILEKELDGKVCLTSGTRFETTKTTQRLSRVVSRTHNEIVRNRLFLLSTRIIFKEVVNPALADGNVVILDSSTLRHLAFTYDKYGGDSDIFRDTLSMVRAGKLDYGISPGVRIILWSSPEGLMKNLSQRNNDIGDPKNIEEVEKRIKAYCHCIEIIRELPVDGEVLWIDFENPPLHCEEIEKTLSNRIKKDILPMIMNYFSF